jgi:hypothetical protein
MGSKRGHPGVGVAHLPVAQQLAHGLGEGHAGEALDDLGEEQVVRVRIGVVRAGLGQFVAQHHGARELLVACPAVLRVRDDAVHEAVEVVAVHAAGMGEQVREGDGL